MKFSKGQSLGQSLIAQFVIFFLIGIALFVTLGNFYRIQSENVRGEILELVVELINSYVSSFAVSSVGRCGDCSAIENYINLDKTYAGYFIELGLADDGLLVSTAPSREAHTSSINNLNETLTIEPGLAASIKTINLTYTRNQNKLEIT